MYLNSLDFIIVLNAIIDLLYILKLKMQIKVFRLDFEFKYQIVRKRLLLLRTTLGRYFCNKSAGRWRILTSASCDDFQF